MAAKEHQAPLKQLLVLIFVQCELIRCTSWGWQIYQYCLETLSRLARSWNTMFTSRQPPSDDISQRGGRTTNQWLYTEMEAIASREEQDSFSWLNKGQCEAMQHVWIPGKYLVGIYCKVWRTLQQATQQHCKKALLSGQFLKDKF